jgi:hypothetical protein
MQRPTAALPITLGIFSTIAGLLSAVFCFVALAWSTWSDGAPPKSSHLDYLLACLPATYCFLIALSCLPFMRGIWLIIIGAVVYILLAVLVVVIVRDLLKHPPEDWGFALTFILLPAFLLAFGWTTLCRRRFRKYDPPADPAFPPSQTPQFPLGN